MGGQLAPYLGEEGCIRLIQCFLNPELMICRPEPLQDLVLGGSYRTLVLGREGKIDHLYQLFTPNEHQQTGEDFGQCLVYYRLLANSSDILMESVYHFDVHGTFSLFLFSY